jgi:hypothetical protein
VQTIRVLAIAVGVLLALARAGLAGPTTTTSTTSSTSSTTSTTTTITSSTSSSTLATTTTTTNTTTTSQFPPVCVGAVEVDPDDTVTGLAPGVTTTIPVRVTVTSGVFDLFVRDQAQLLFCFRSPVAALPGQPLTVDCSYATAANPPSQITITAILSPHSLGSSCGSGSLSDVDSKAFPVAGATTTSTTTTTSSTTSTTTIPDGRIAVCHKNRNTLLVDASALEAHLRHGDSEGPCLAD